MWEIEFYETPDGHCPTVEFLRSLHKTIELPYAINRLDMLAESGNQLRRPIADYLQDHIYELRIPIRRTQYRILYFFYFQNHIVTCQGIRKEGKVPQGEIDKAIRYRAQYLASHEKQK